MPPEENQTVAATTEAEQTSAAPVGEEQSQEGASNQVAADKETGQDHNWKAANLAMKTQSQEIRQLREELQRQNAPKADPKKGYFEGKDPDDIPTVGELQSVIESQNSQQQAKIAQLEALTQYPDLNSVVEKYGKSLPESVKTAIVSSPNPYLAAYEACKSSGDYYKDQMSNTQHADAKKALDNAQKPGSASSVGGTGALSQASKYEAMDYSDVLSMSDNIIRGG